ncbi:MAG TPA: glutamate decarboxylase, partial [bacterium]|nr:glutamate decarboxylase [bacterium]
MLSKKVDLDQVRDSRKGHASTYSLRYFKEEVPKFELPEKTMPANAAYQIIHDELKLNARPGLNLASFVTTWMEPEAERLISENLNVNFIDHDEYPQTEVIHHRLVNMLARLFNSPPDCASVGTATVGSSEAIMLALLSHKWTWRLKRQREGGPADRPNIVFGADAHICWEKFARYFDVEMRVVPLTKDRFFITAEQVEPLIDENTTCVGGILGTTCTGEADDFQGLDRLLVRIKRERGWDIPIHIDGASGGFTVPFTRPDLRWDFRLEQVKSINVSGHKFGLVYPGLGWVIWRDESDFPEELIFKVNYLGGWMPTYTLNFSRGSFPIIAQYYNFLRLGREGYAEIMGNCLENARYLAGRLEKSGKFEMINRGSLLPIVALRLREGTKGYTVFDLSEKLRERGWVVSAYTLPPDAQDLAVMRVVCREHFSRDMADILCRDTLSA